MKILLFIIQMTTYGQNYTKIKAIKKKAHIPYNMRQFVNHCKPRTVYCALGTVFTGTSLFYLIVLTSFL